MEIRELVHRRILALQEKMEANSLDIVVLMKPENVYYLSNFNPIINSYPCFVIVSKKKGACLLVHSLRNDHARQEAALNNVQLYGKWGGNPSLAMQPVDAIRKIIGNELVCLGIEMEYINYSFWDSMAKNLNLRTVQDVSLMISMMKIIKDKYEISNVRNAALLVDNGVETAIHALEQGYSEAEASTEGQYRMRQIWAERFPMAEVSGFGTSEGGMIDSLHVWCLINERIAYGCDCPKYYVPVAGDIVLSNAWAKVNGYHAENERTIIINELNGTRARAYDAMLEARKAIFDALKPGVTFGSLYIKATDVFCAYGFGDILPGRVGHGVGCSAHEYPSLNKGNTIQMAPGMVLTVEPGLMNKAWGGVRHSDTVLVTKDGFERLTKLDYGRIVIHK